MFYSGTSNILNGQSDLYKTNNQLSTGRRILSPRDNPVDSTLALMTTQAKEVNATFIKNQGFASDHLSDLDTQLGLATDLLQDVLSRSIQGGNSSYNPQQKQAIAEELRRRLDSLVDIANARDGAGDYLFAGNITNAKPFSVTGSAGNYDLAGTSYVTYSGDDGRRLLQVEASQEVATSESGQDVFMRITDGNGNLLGRSVFDAVKNMIDNLDSASGVVPKPSYDQALGDLHAALDHISKARASVGARLNQLEALTNAGGDVAVKYETRLANLEGLDYAEAISRLNQQKMQLEASQQSFIKTTELRLFNLI
jgi:flagellar hook-associated protein 3 FlgL